MSARGGWGGEGGRVGWAGVGWGGVVWGGVGWEGVRVERGRGLTGLLRYPIMTLRPRRQISPWPSSRLPVALSSGAKSLPLTVSSMTDPGQMAVPTVPCGGAREGIVGEAAGGGVKGGREGCGGRDVGGGGVKGGRGGCGGRDVGGEGGGT